MAQITQEDIARAKALGFLRNRGTDCFSGRLVPRGASFSAEELRSVAECAARFGSGEVAFTVRMSAEIVGIPCDKIDEARAFIAERTGLAFGGTGAKVRPIVACKGSTCVYGSSDVRALARALHDACYIGLRDTALPHKFKIAVGGCPNSCVKPTLHDFAVEARRGQGYQVYVGGQWGRATKRAGTAIDALVPEEAVVPVALACIAWYRENGKPKERFGETIERLGVARIAEAIERAIRDHDARK